MIITHKLPRIIYVDSDFTQNIHSKYSAKPFCLYLFICSISNVGEKKKKKQQPVLSPWQQQQTWWHWGTLFLRTSWERDKRWGSAVTGRGCEVSKYIMTWGKRIVFAWVLHILLFIFLFGRASLWFCLPTLTISHGDWSCYSVSCVSVSFQWTCRNTDKMNAEDLIVSDVRSVHYLSLDPPHTAQLRCWGAELSKQRFYWVSEEKRRRGQGSVHEGQRPCRALYF